MATKINFTKSMIVLKIRETYKAPYHKTRFLNIKRKHLKTKKEFKEFLEQYTQYWSAGFYEIQYNVKEKLYSTFIRFNVKEGKVTDLLKESPYSKAKYPLWSFVK